MMDEKPMDEKPIAEKPGTNRWLPYVALAAALAAGYFSFDWAVGAAIHSRKLVAVPDLSSKGVNDALNMLAPLGLGLEKEGEQFDKRFPAGAIVHQTPAPGMSVREGRIVRVTVSQGGETLFVPNLVGQPLRNTQTTLQNMGLSVGEIENRPSLKFAKDQVMATDPPAGAIIAKNGLVNLVLSEGPPAADVVLIPDFVGENISKAKEWTTAHQMSVSLREEADISKSDGEVLMQSPTADTPVHPGDTLTLVVNQPGASPADQAQGLRIYYEVPQGASDRDIRVSVIDETGEREVFRRSQSPGSKVDIRVQPKGRARARIFVNGVMVEEQPLQ
jgi:serine/threonine-protein kinase